MAKCKHCKNDATHQIAGGVKLCGEHASAAKHQGSLVVVLAETNPDPTQEIEE